MNLLIIYATIVQKQHCISAIVLFDLYIACTTIHIAYAVYMLFTCSTDAIHMEMYQSYVVHMDCIHIVYGLYHLHVAHIHFIYSVYGVQIDYIWATWRDRMI